MSRIASPVIALLLASWSWPAITFSRDASASPAASAAPAAPAARDWLTWGYDQERTGWNKGESTLTTTNVSNLKLLWSAQLSTPPTDIVLSTLTAALVAEGVKTARGVRNLLYILGADNTLFAIDADSGKVFWQKTFKNPLSPQRAATWLCANSAQATPVIDKLRGIIYVLTSDGKLRGVSLSDGAERMAPTVLVSPFARAWSLNLIDNVIYTTNARGCGQIFDPRSDHAAAASPLPPGAITAAAGGDATSANLTGPFDPAAISAVDVSNPAHPQTTHFFTSGSRPAGSWGHGGVARAPKGIVTQTADGLYDPAAGSYGQSVLQLAPKATRLMDSFTPANWRFLNSRDLDLGSASPLVFRFQNRTLIASAGKEGVVYLLDSDDVGGGPPAHSTPLYRSPQLGNDAGQSVEPGQGVWGAMTTYETADGRRFLYVPMWGPPSKNAPAFKHGDGDIPHGSILALQVSTNGDGVSLEPQWSSPDLVVPGPPVVANGVLYAIETGEQTLQSRPRSPDEPVVRPSLAEAAKFRATPVGNLTLYAFDAETGQQLYSSQKIIANWTHFSEPVVALGKVFVVTHDAHVYAFGLGR
jgi:outer membrane protein assembly factor BamB